MTGVTGVSSLTSYWEMTELLAPKEGSRNRQWKRLLGRRASQVPSRSAASGAVMEPAGRPHPRDKLLPGGMLPCGGEGPTVTSARFPCSASFSWECVGRSAAPTVCLVPHPTMRCVRGWWAGSDRGRVLIVGVCSALRAGLVGPRRASCVDGLARVVWFRVGPVCGGHGAALFTLMAPSCWRSCQVRWPTQLYSEGASHASRDP